MKKTFGIILTLLSFSFADNIDNDSLRLLPPRLRGIGDAEYFSTFIKPRDRDSLDMRLVGRWPFGPGFEVYGDSARQIVCYGGGSGVLLFDISTPDNPVRLSQICADGLINQLLIKDSLLFVASNGLAIYNITDPVNPTRIGTAVIPVRDFCIKDTFAYCVAGDSLRILNIADLSNPYQITAMIDSGGIIGISGNCVYTGGRWQLNAIDITNPNNPQVINSIPAYIRAMAVDGSQLYANNNSTGFTIYNISNPLNIWQESAISSLGGYDMHKHGDYVYLPVFCIVDVSDSANPAIVGDTTLPITAYSVWVNSNFGYAYVANYYDGLRPIEINNPTNPLPGNSFYGAHDSRDVFVQGNYAYIANSASGLKILDISQPSNPYEVGSYDTVGFEPELRAVAIRDSIAYMAIQSLQNPPQYFWFKTINIANPTFPTLVGKCRVLWGISEDIVVRDSLAYILFNGPIIQPIKISNPSLPETLKHYLLPGNISPCNLFIQDTIAYVADGDSGLRIISIANPASLYEIGHYNAPDVVYSVFVKDTLAYLAALSAGLRIVNIKNPASPQEIGYYITTGSARDVIVVDSLAYVAAAGLRLIKISNPINPQEVGYYMTSYAPRRLFFNYPYLFAACYESGMDIMQWLGIGIEEKNSNYTLSDFFLAPTISNSFINLSTNVSGHNYQIKIYDCAGRIVKYDQIASSVNKINYCVNLRDLAGGVYFVVVTNDKVELIKKIIVVR